MIRTILVPVIGDEVDAATFATAIAIGRPFGAHIDALHVRIDPTEIAAAMAADGPSAIRMDNLVRQIERDADAREAEAQDNFSQFCAREKLLLAADRTEAGGNPSCQWHVEVGQPSRWTARYGMAADLIVASRGVPGNDATARAVLEALLLETGRPVLIPGTPIPSPLKAERVGIAWKSMPQAARAVTGALPLLERAREVTILVVSEEDGRSENAGRLSAYLAWHGVSARIERLIPGPHGAIETLVAATAERADLLVMGGYGYMRQKEWVFGGFTQRLLSAAPTNVLMAH